MPGPVDLRGAVFLLTSSVGAQEVRAIDFKPANDPADDAALEPALEQGLEALRSATRSWLASRPALGGRLSNSHVPFV